MPLLQRMRDSILRDQMTDTNENLRYTPLHTLHLELGGKMVPFAGYAMPVQYPAGILKEHLHTREKAGLFDVSHMGQAFLVGANPAAALERVTPADIQGIAEGMQRYGLLLNDAGGIKDDFMTTRLAGEVLERHSPGISQMTFMQAKRVIVAGAPAIVSRTGYTGEDGFEISIEGQHAERVARALLAEAEVLPIGLGARDSLRLEAGLCLYGHDMDESTDPVEANLVWSLGKRRKEARDFPGADRITDHLLSGAKKKRVGLRPEGRAPAREGTEIADKTGRVVGRVTSGGFGPSLNAPLAMGYVESEFTAIGTKLDLLVRGKALGADVVAMPFVPSRYKRAKK